MTRPCTQSISPGSRFRENLVVAGSPILNTPVLGALARIGIVSMESAKKAIREMFTDERNVQAAEAAYQGAGRMRKRLAISKPCRGGIGKDRIMESLSSCRRQGEMQCLRSLRDVLP